MLEIRKKSFSQNYENSFFRTFSKDLYKKFEQKNLEGVLIGSPFCSMDERLQIDALLITYNSICLIDFKNYGGKIILPNQQNFDNDSGLWTTEEGINIKGGSYNNPFIQLKRQKQRFINVFIDYIEKNLQSNDKCNPYHCIRLVCFHKEVELVGEIPGNHEKNFKILHKGNYLSGIVDILETTTSEIRLGKNSFNEFKRIFQADQYNLNEETNRDVFEEISAKESNLDFSILYEDQQEVLSKISDFIKNPQKQVFILQGTSNSGKSFLIPYIEKIAENSGIEEVLMFAQSKRVARNLMVNFNHENVNSIYSYIYGRNYIKANNDDHEEQENEQNENIDTIDVVPLKQCDNSDNSIFIVDESHLISDNLYESFDLRFGSGHLLKDYLEFTDFKNSHRKIIFIGDPFQLSLGNNQESPLHRHYLEEKYQLIVDVAQLLDKPSYSLINNEFLKCVSSIRKKIFNHLCIAHIPDIVIHLQKEEISDYLSTLHKTDIHIISYSNEKSNEINLWIKRKLLNSGENISVGDIILFHNNINVANDHDLFAPIQPIYNGDFAEITEIIESSKKEEIITKNTSVILKFITVDIQLTNTRKICRIFILENYLTNPKGELNKEEIIALKILLNRYLKKEISHCPFESSNEYSSVISSEEYRKLETEIDNLKVKLNNGEKVKTKLSETEKQLKRLVNHAKKQYNHKVKLQLQNNPSSKYFQLKNIAFIKYGYAMTVHKAMSYKWSKVIFNADQGENRGRTNESYFKWLYTGITRATSQIILYGCSSINPLSNPELKIQNLSNQKINKDWVSSYFTSKQCSDIEQLFTTLPDNLKQDFVDEFRIYEVIDICLFISRKIECSDLKIQAVKHKQYQEIYEISDILNPDKTARVIIYYDKNGRFKAPTIQKSSSTEFADYVLLALSKKMAISQLFLLKQDTWREKLYNDIFEKLKMREIYVEDIFENNYYDLLKLFNVTTNNQLCIKIDYNGEGFISTITAIDCEDLNLWNYFQEIIQEYN